MSSIINLIDLISEPSPDQEPMAADIPVTTEPEVSKPEPAPAHLQAIEDASHVDSNEISETIRLGQQAELTPEEVHRNPDAAKRLAWLNSLEVGTLGERSPKTASWLANPQNAAVAKDDIPTLEEIERRVRANKEIGDDVLALSGVADTWLVGLAKMPKQLGMMLGEAHDHTIWGMQEKKMREDAVAAGDHERVKWLDERQEQRDQYIDETKDWLGWASEVQMDLTPQNLSPTMEGVRGGVTMLMDMAPGVAVSIATRGRVNPTLPFLTAKTGLDSYESARENGLSFEKAMRYGAIDSIIEYGTERMPTKMLEGLFGELGKRGAAGRIKDWVVTEAYTEQLATLGQSANALAHDLDEQLAGAINQGDWGAVAEIQAQRQYVTAVATLVGGGSMSAGMGLVNYYGNKQVRAERHALTQIYKRMGSSEAQKGLDELISYAQSAKVNAQAAGHFADFIESLEDDQKIYVAAEAIEQMTDPPSDLLDQMEDGSGGYVEMPLSRFLTEFAPDDEKLALMRRYIKTNEALETIDEIEQEDNSDYIRQILASATESKQTSDAAKEIYNNVTEQLVETGRMSRDVARQSARLIPAMVTVQYEHLRRAGITNEDGSEISLQQLYDDINLRIAGPNLEETEGAEFLNQGEQDEYNAAMAKGLDMSQAGRMERAQAAGYDVSNIYFHGTAAEFDRFDTMGFGAWFSTDPRMAEIYANQSRHRITQRDMVLDTQEQEDALVAETGMGERSVPVYLRIRKPFVIPMDMNEAIDLPTFFEAINRENGTNLTPQMMDMAVDPRMSYMAWEVIQERNDLFIEALRAEGFDGIEAYERGILTKNVFDPEQIRSIHAAFDPDWSDNPRILRQQNLGDMTLTEDVTDEAGNMYTVTQKAQKLWDKLQQRKDVIEALEVCLGS